MQGSHLDEMSWLSTGTMQECTCLSQAEARAQCNVLQYMVFAPVAYLPDYGEAACSCSQGQHPLLKIGLQAGV